MINKITHLGNGDFEVTLEDGTTKKAGSNLVGMIRYTYFENETNYPPINWEVKHSKLMEDYFPKVQKDISSGKINEKNSNIRIR